VRLLRVCNEAFHGYMIYLSVIVSGLPLGVEIDVGTSGNCEDCTMGWESFALLLRFLILLRRLWWWISFIFYLRVIVWPWVGDLWTWWRILDLWTWWGVCELWSWWMLWMVGCGVMPEVVFGWFGRLVVKKAEDKMVSTVDGEGSIAWCG
jgi:hypothetical protein